MAHEIEIYEDGSLQDRLETENFIIVAMGDESIHSRRNVGTDLLEKNIFFDALLRETEYIGKHIVKELYEAGLTLEKMLEIANTEEPTNVEEPIEAERVEMTPEVIEAIVRQAKNQAEGPRFSKSTAHRVVVKFLSSLRKALSARN